MIPDKVSEQLNIVQLYLADCKKAGDATMVFMLSDNELWDNDTLVGKYSEKPGTFAYQAILKFFRQSQLHVQTTTNQVTVIFRR